MKNISALPNSVCDAIIKHLGIEDCSSELQDNRLRELSVEEAFECFCTWHGIINWSDNLIYALDSIRKANQS